MPLFSFSGLNTPVHSQVKNLDAFPLATIEAHLHLLPVCRSLRAKEESKPLTSLVSLISMSDKNQGEENFIKKLFSKLQPPARQWNSLASPQTCRDCWAWSNLCFSSAKGTAPVSASWNCEILWLNGKNPKATWSPALQLLVSLTLQGRQKRSITTLPLYDDHLTFNICHSRWRASRFIIFVRKHCMVYCITCVVHHCQDEIKLNHQGNLFPTQLVWLHCLQQNHFPIREMVSRVLRHPPLLSM